MVSLHQTGYVIKSNRESGQRRYDIAIIPQYASKLDIMLELKQKDLLKVKPSKIKPLLGSAAATAFAQIELNCYDTELRQANISKICQIAIAFCSKQFQLQHTIKTYPQNIV